MRSSLYMATGHLHTATLATLATLLKPSGLLWRRSTPLSKDREQFVSGILSARLLLRQWKQSDYEPFARLNADPEVMRYFPAPLDRSESDASARGHQSFIEHHGWGRWAAEERATGQFIGFIGLYIPQVALPFSPCVEIGWRLAKTHWGTGLASEGAAAVLRHAFATLKMAEVVSFTPMHNLKSQAVMERLGMRRDSLTFAHPSLPADHHLSEHCLYRISSL